MGIDGQFTQLNTEFYNSCIICICYMYENVIFFQSTARLTTEVEMEADL